jgi:hypothetical protein
MRWRRHETYLSFGCRSSVASIAMCPVRGRCSAPTGNRHRLCDGSSLTYQPPTARFQLFVLTRTTCCAGSAFSAPLTSSGARRRAARSAISFGGSEAHQIPSVTAERVRGARQRER